MSIAIANSDVSPPVVRQRPASRAADVVLILLVFFIAAGDPVPGVNETHYLCRLKHYWNSAWCAGDLFLKSADTQLVFIWAFGWVTRWLSLSATAWLGRLLAWTLLAWSWQRLSWRLVPLPLAAVLSAALFVSLNQQAHLAGEWIVGGVEAKCFAYGFVLLALAELVDRHWNRVGLLLGAGIAVHPLVGGWSALVCGGLWLVDRLAGWTRKETADAGPTPIPLIGLVGGGLLALVGLIPALSLTWNQPADLVAEASSIYVFERLPHHLALLALPHEELTRRLGGHVVLLVALAALTVTARRQPVFRVAQFAWGAVVLACVGLAIERGLAHQPLLAARLQRYYWYRLTDFAAPLAVASATTAVIARGVVERKVWAGLGLTAAVAFWGWQLSSIVWTRLLDPVPPADAKMKDYAAWVDVCRWIAFNTPADALFLTPRLNQSFKWRTGRPEVVNRKDIPQDTRGILEWDRRIQDIYYDEAPGGLEVRVDSLGQLGADRVRKLAEKYGARFILSDRGQLLSLPWVYWNDEYVVYRLEDRPAADRRRSARSADRGAAD